MPSMSAESNLKIVETYFNLLKARDRDGLAGILSADILVRYHGPTGSMPWVGDFKGINGFQEFLAVIAGNFDIVEVNRIDTIANERKVVVQSKGHWRAKTTGKDIHASMVNVFSFDQNKISCYEVYADTLAFAEGVKK